LQQDREAVPSCSKQNGHSARLLFDTDGEIARRYRAAAIPRSFIIDKHGYNVEKLVGEVDRNPQA
jgi:dUTPase